MKTARFCLLGISPAMLAALVLLVPAAIAQTAAASADLWQARNGAADSPVTPVEWVKGNVGPANSHYVEGQSIPYRMVMTGLANGPHTLILEWDTLQRGKHAIDYLTHYDRLVPHDQFVSHTTAEAINPLAGIGPTFGSSNTFQIPAPSSVSSPVAGQPTASFEGVPPAERVMTIWNGTVTRLTYLTEEPLIGDSAVTRLAVEFLAEAETVVIAWGGHIGSKLDWGSGSSASSIGGSPYHMRKIDLDGAGGNQDRSVQALAVVSEPTSIVTGPSTVCQYTTNWLTVTTDSTDPATTFQWSLSNNTAGAIIVGKTNASTVEVMTGSAGTYSLQALVFVGAAKGIGTFDVSVNPATAIYPLTDQTVCPRSDVTFSVIPFGTAPFALIWTKDGQVIPGATNDSLVLGNVVAADAGRYCVKAVGACGSASSCATLTVEPAPVLVGPPDIAWQCLADVPPADPSSVQIIGGTGLVTVEHVRDVVQTNDCDILVVRTYQATDSCASQASWQQTITVRDTKAPTFAALPDRSVECGLDWSFDAPSVTDQCDGTNVTLVVAGTVTNGISGKSYTATQTWRATDRCGNSATASQTITVADTTAPQIVCATNTVALTTGPAGAIVSFPVSATDACDANVLVTCLPPSGSLFPLGSTSVQCTATDVNGNVGRCSFTVTIIDVEPPSITCPADVFVVEDAPGSGRAVATFTAPTVSDNADTNPLVVCSPPSGFVFPVGDTAVHCVATDASGNTNSCSFQVRIVPQVIVANSLADSGTGSLRQALLDANAAPGSNVIAFAFPGGPPFVIHLLSPLPTIVDPVVIDGWSQLEFIGLPLIELDGSNVVTTGTSPVGLTLIAGNSEVRGLILTGFEIALWVTGSGGNIIQGNFIGIDQTGATPPGNRGDGIRIESPNNRIGGDEPAARNVISANRGHGLVLDGTNTINNVVAGNRIGTDEGGTSPSANDGNGILLRNGAADNYIGPSNVIAFNALNGILLESSAGNGNAIRGNSIFSNGALGIDLGGDGATPNDDPDTDAGPNESQNFPVLANALVVGSITAVDGTLRSAANSLFHLEFFHTAAADPAGFGEGKRFLGLATVTTDASGLGSFSITLPATPPDEFITATVTDSSDNTSEFSPAMKVGGTPVIVIPPIGTNTPPGESVTFCVTAEGSQPLAYQWRLNGANIPGATNACFTVESAQLTNGGSYTAVVANDLGVVISDPAVLDLILPFIQLGDNFADRVRLTNSSGTLSGNNSAATREAGEPNHADKPGGKSIWYTWTAPATGIATFSTIGSAFDTLLAVYTGGPVSNLTVVASDEDRGGFFTSLLRFNAMAGVQYHIAIDGFGGDSGEFVFNWSFENTDRLLPVIFDPPASRTVLPGATVTFKVDASVDCRLPHYNCRRVNKDQPPEHPSDRDPLNYQWYFNGVAIPGATQSSYTVTNAQADAVGNYSVLVGTDGQSLETLPANLQLNESGVTSQNVQAKDKFLDAAIAAPLRLGTPSEQLTPAADPGEPEFAPAVIVRSYTSTQVFSSVGGTTSAGELLPCYGVGGASEWFAVVAEESGTLYVNTDGSSYDTVLAVYSFGPTNTGLSLLGCDNNSGIDRKDSAVAVPVEAGRTNFVVIDGYNGAYGVASLHFSLVTQGALAPAGFTAQKAMRLRLTGQPTMRFIIQASTNFANWAPLTTNSSSTGTFDFIDNRSTNAPRRFYRALMLP